MKIRVYKVERGDILEDGSVVKDLNYPFPYKPGVRLLVLETAERMCARVELHGMDYIEVTRG